MLSAPHPPTLYFGEKNPEKYEKKSKQENEEGERKECRRK